MATKQLSLRFDTVVLSQVGKVLDRIRGEETFPSAKRAEVIEYLVRLGLAADAEGYTVTARGELKRRRLRTPNPDR